jgi:hypothetical protein
MSSPLMSAYGNLLSQHSNDLPTDLGHLSEDDLHRVLADLFEALETQSAIDEGVGLDAYIFGFSRPMLTAPRHEIEQALRQAHRDLEHLQNQWAHNAKAA